MVCTHWIHSCDHPQIVVANVRFLQYVLVSSWKLVARFAREVQYPEVSRSIAADFANAERVLVDRVIGRSSTQWLCAKMGYVVPQEGRLQKENRIPLAISSTEW